jgi:putative CocE/NonD family hydrolase
MNWLKVAVVLVLAGCTPAPESDDTDATAVRVPTITEAWIPMEDGVRLAADIYWPEGFEESGQYPVLLEYTPYRKDESRARNHDLFSYFLAHGYVVARVDIRGTGNSEGVTIPYEYSDIELDDGEVVIDWLSRQDWSTGKVGMFGISWGGFNAIQMAMRNPPAMKAFVALMSTEYLYQEDVHFMDGIIHVDSWMMSHDLYNSMPGAPNFVMNEEWLENRFNRKPSVYAYMQQQRDGPWWDRASAKGQYEKIKVPGFHIGGWYDGYRNSPPRMLEHMDAPVKAMIGPWDHFFPHAAWPAPQMEWRHEAVRWFDHFMKDIDTGILEEPKFAVYVRDYYPPDPATAEIPGHWRWEDSWPVERIQTQEWFAQADNGLSLEQAEGTSHNMTYKASIGLEGGGPTMWWGSITPDQQGMDDFSLVYDSEPLTAPLEILGRPMAKLHVSADATRANWIVRISDVAPDGQVTQVAGAAINGAHRNSTREPEAITPNEVFPLDVQLHLTSWVFPEGHKIRIAVSNSMWPMLWPTPSPYTSTLVIGGDKGARIELPVVPAGEERMPQFKEPVIVEKLAGFETLDSGNITGYAAITEIKTDAETGEAFGFANNSGATRYPWGIERYEEEIEHRTNDENPANTSVTGRYALTQELQDRTLRFETDVSLSSDADNFRLKFDRKVFVDGELYAEKAWDEEVARDFQ